MHETNEEVVFPRPREIRVQACEMPKPAPDEVLIRSRRTLISTGTELTVLAGDYPVDSAWSSMITFPSRPGYSNIGEVIAVGNDVRDLKQGQRVATLRNHGKYVTAKSNACRLVPDNISDDQAVFFALAEIVMNGIRRSELVWGETAAVFGLGLLGQLTVQICYRIGAQTVIGIDIAQQRLKNLPVAQRIHAINATAVDVKSKVNEITNKRLADVVFEVTGNPQVIANQPAILRQQGRFVLLSAPRGPTLYDFHDLCVFPSYQIIGAHTGSHPTVPTPQNPWTAQRHGELFFEYLSDDTLTVDNLISHKQPYQDAPELYEMLLNDRAGAMGVVFEW